MYSYGAFAKLIIVLLSIAIIYLIIRRIHTKRKEDTDDRNK